jgi:hypothetical protein
MPTRNRIVTQGRDGQIVRAVHAALSNVASLPAAGRPYSPPELAAVVQRRIDAASAVGQAKAQWLDAVKAYAAADAEAIPVVRALKQYVINLFGETSPVLAEFGFVAPKRASLTPEQKAAAVAKRAATRKARHTMGKKQKKAIHGAVPATGPASGGERGPAAAPSNSARSTSLAQDSEPT